MMDVTEQDKAVFREAFYRNTGDETDDPVEIGLKAVFAARAPSLVRQDQDRLLSTGETSTPVNPRSAKCVSQGYALCDPTGKLASLSFRSTKQDAITACFAPEDWASRESDGWSAEFVYARMFTPKFYVDVVPEERAGA